MGTSNNLYTHITWCFSLKLHTHGMNIPISWGTKERFWLTLAPENNTAKLYMVERVIIWGI